MNPRALVLSAAALSQAYSPQDYRSRLYAHVMPPAHQAHTDPAAERAELDREERRLAAEQAQVAAEQAKVAAEQLSLRERQQRLDQVSWQPAAPAQDTWEPDAPAQDSWEPDAPAQDSWEPDAPAESPPAAHQRMQRPAPQKHTARQPPAPQKQEQPQQLDLAPLHAMRGGLVGLRNKLATELADIHSIPFPEPAAPDDLDEHFSQLTQRLLGMETRLEDKQLQSGAQGAQASELRNLAAQARGVLAGVDGQTPASALAKAQRALAALKQTLDRLPRARAKPHSLVEQTAVSAQVAQLQEQERKYDQVSAAVDALGADIKLQVDGLQQSQQEEAKSMANNLQHVLFQAGLESPTPKPKRAKAPNLAKLAEPTDFELEDPVPDNLEMREDEAQLRGAA